MIPTLRELVHEALSNCLDNMGQDYYQSWTADDIVSDMFAYDLFCDMATEPSREELLPITQEWIDNVYA